MGKSNRSIVSVVLPVYNAEIYIGNTVESILNQTYTELEVIIIDDGSNDNSMLKISNYAIMDNRIKVINNKLNIGVAESRNKGIRMSTGKYIAFIDSDDLWEIDKIEKQLFYMEKYNVDFCGTSYKIIDEKGEIKKKIEYCESSITMREILKNNKICLSSSMIKTDIAKKNKMISTFLHEDYVFWLDLLEQNYRGSIMKDCLTYYRKLKNSRSHNKIRACYERWRIYRQHLKFNVFTSLKYIFIYAVNGIKKRV